MVEGGTPNTLFRRGLRKQDLLGALYFSARRERVPHETQTSQRKGDANVRAASPRASGGYLLRGGGGAGNLHSWLYPVV